MNVYSKHISRACDTHQIAHLYVPVHHPSLVAVVNSSQQLAHEAFDLCTFSNKSVMIYRH